MNMQTSDSNTNFSSFSGVIDALQDILARSQVTMPDLESTYSQASFLNLNRSGIKLNDQIIGAIITERQQQLDAVSLEFSGLDSVMDGIRNLREQLGQKKDKITQSLNFHKRLGSVLWHVPNEVLSQIFHYCLPKSDDFQVPSDRAAPMSLTGVFQRWREVSVGTPSLWWRLCVLPDQRYRWNREIFCHDLWLKRSRGRPLSLELSCYKNWHTSELRSLLQPYINQISSLSITFFLGGKKPDLILTDIPALQELTIHAMNLNGSAIVQCIPQLPITLRSLKITGLSFDLWHVSICHRVWANLTNVTIAIHEPITLLRLLQLAPNLASLAISTPLLSIQDLEPFTHFRLQSLKINRRYKRQHRLSDLFNSLSLPNLRTFEAGHIQTWPHAEFKAFVIRSYCPLETLFLGDEIGTTDAQRAECVALIPSLKAVTLHSDLSDAEDG